VPGGHISLNGNAAHQIHGVSWCFHAPRKPKANDVKANEFIEQWWE